MKKQIVLIITCCILLVSIPMLFFSFILLIPNQFEETFLGELKYKYDAIKSTHGKRVIVIGGSSVAFGQYSDLIEKELPEYKVVNFGMYAGLGSTVMLDLAKPYIHEGDIVIFAPEQSEQTLSNYFNSELMWQGVDGEFSILSDLPMDKLGAMVGQSYYFGRDKFNYSKSGGLPLGEGVYKKESFNSYGDIVYSDRNKNIMSGGYDSSTLISFSENIITEEFIEYANEFSKDCEELGAVVYYRFSPMNSLAVQDTKEIEIYYNYLDSKLNFDIIGTIDRSLMEPEWFYDTNFHLNSQGAVLNTKYIIEDLKGVLNDNSKTSIVIPKMPSIKNSRLYMGDNADLDSFIYEVVDNEVGIAGLSETGELKEKITIPTEYNNLPITTFDKSVFKGNEIIKEITIQSNITRIENKSFEGCRNLESIIIANSRPESCTVSNNLLVGTKAKIFVPMDSLFLYKTNYFWSVYSDRILSSDIDIEINEKINTELLEESDEFITYVANGGVAIESGEEVLKLPMSTGHLSTNTALGNKYFKRDGYTIYGWSTMAEGSGEYVGFGSRVEKSEDLVLYAQWQKTSSIDDLEYIVENNEVKIIKYIGESLVCAIPEEIEGKKVTAINRGAFENSKIDTVMLPPTIFSVSRGAFSNSAIKEIYLYDSLYYIYDESFENCNELKTLHINAATNPVYSGSYFDTFSDKFAWLKSIKDEKKIVLFSGSSARYGYDSEKIDEAFPEYQVANMGVYAYTNALPQLMIIKTQMNEGDILLSAPEFDTIKNQFCTTNALDLLFFPMMESNYDMVSLLDLREYIEVFDSLGSYLTTRSTMGSKNYSISPSYYDDEGRKIEYKTYNKYGDFILKRPNGEKDELLQTVLADYTVKSFPNEVINSINRVYDSFKKENIVVYFTYAPRNWSSMTEDSTLEARNKLQNYLEENLSAEVISNVEDYLYSGIYFYLIDNHLSDEGVQIRTENIIRDLKTHLE